MPLEDKEIKTKDFLIVSLKQRRNLMELGTEISCAMFWHTLEGSQITAKKNAWSGKVL